MNPLINTLFNEYHALTGDAQAAASLVLAHASLVARSDDPPATNAGFPHKGPWTIKQTAQAMKASERTVRELIKAGRLKAHKIGAGRGVLRILPEHVAEFQREGTDAARPRPHFRHRSPS